MRTSRGLTDPNFLRRESYPHPKIRIRKRTNADHLADCHYALPKPVDGLTDNDVRIPTPLPSDGQPFLINVENPPKEMSPEGLLEQHITRWREIRRK
ncbi:hypothetical protein X801_01390 [Opisthorchis viverrini]|uniref:Uncharacterized protein n=1 Tax=Opisthorchis viverrini TaxID=6198 RepID=A0A1S8X7J5_OPIVI|nr:hypothetical protein X801_01390 [Opisthorchis viverrini]